MTKRKTENGKRKTEDLSALAPFSCANCKYRMVLDVRSDAGECRRHPMTYVEVLDEWLSPPAPDTFLCGEHVLKCNS